MKTCFNIYHSYVFHDAYLRLQRIDDWQWVNNIRAFIFKVTNNLIIDRLRREKKQIDPKEIESSDYLSYLQTNHRSPLVEALGSEKTAILKNTLNSLPEKCLIVFMMHRFGGLKQAEIAKELNMSIKSVERYMHMALKECRQSLRRYKNN